MLMGEQQTELATQLQSALNSRAIIEQAKVSSSSARVCPRMPPTSNYGLRPGPSGASWPSSPRSWSAVPSVNRTGLDRNPCHDAAGELPRFGGRREVCPRRSAG